jgi:hypothetical protein
VLSRPASTPTSVKYSDAFGPLCSHGLDVRRVRAGHAVAGARAQHTWDVNATENKRMMADTADRVSCTQNPAHPYLFIAAVARFNALRAASPRLE